MSHGKSSQLATCACVLGMVTNLQHQSAFLKFGLGLALNTMSSSFRKLAGGQLYSCPLSWEASIMQRCSYKCHSWMAMQLAMLYSLGTLSQRKSTVELGKQTFFFPCSGDLKLWHLKTKMQGLPWWSSGWESVFQCRGHGFNPWSGNWDPTCHVATKPSGCKYWAHNEEPARRNEHPAQTKIKNKNKQTKNPQKTRMHFQEPVLHYHSKCHHNLNQNFPPDWSA